MKDNKKWLNIATCAVFLVFIFGLSISSLVTKTKSYSERERRYLEQMPKLSKESIFNGEFSKKYETFITDQFIARDSWIKVKTLTERMMGKQDINDVYFAKDDYLIEKVEDINQVQWEKNKRWIADFLVRTHDRLGDDHVKALFAPTAGYVMNNKLPAFAPFYDQSQINKEMIEALKERLPDAVSQSIVVDVNQTLRDKNNEYIYYRTDHHWTSLGAYYAYVEWAKSMELTPKRLEDYKQIEASTEFFGTIYNKVNTTIKPDTITLFDDGEAYKVSINMGEKNLDSLFDYEQLNGVDPYSVFLGGNNAMVQITSKNTNGRRLLVIKDSYAHSVVPLLAHHFEEVVLVDLRHLNMEMEGIMDQLGITDVLVLYNDNNVTSDKNLGKLSK